MQSLASRKDLNALLLKCCGSTRWARSIAQEIVSRCSSSSSRDAGDVSFEELSSLADRVWWRDMDEKDWLEAFEAHPRIGDKEALRKKYEAASKASTASASSSPWEAGEQAGTSGASEAVLTELERMNRAYEDRYGFIFLVCATGKTAEEMLSILKSRMRNDVRDELRIAAGEQAKITRLRLEKLLEQVRAEARL